MSAPLPQQDLDHVLGHTEALWEDVRGRTVFMTGGTGFVGTWMLESLLRANDVLGLGANVVVLTRDPALFGKSAPHNALHPAVRLVGGSLATVAFPRGDFPFIVHAAVEPVFVGDAAHPLGSYGQEFDGTRRLLEFACGHGARRLLFTSSGAVYGTQPSDLSHVPEGFVGAPATTDVGAVYGQAKRACESMITLYGRASGFDALVARLFAFVGPRLPLDAHYAVGNFIGDVLREKPIRIAGDGTAYRSYLYAADLAIWLWTILLRGRHAHPYNVGSPSALSISDLAHTVIDVLAPGSAVEISAARVPGAPASRYVPCVERAASELGLRSLIMLEEGLRRTAKWHRMAKSSDGTGTAHSPVV